MVVALYVTAIGYQIEKSAECSLIKSAIAKPSGTEPPKESMCSSISPFLA